MKELREQGWSHIILSNHVPELPAIVQYLGLSPLCDQVLSSANIGAEEPHPEAYRLARLAAGNPEILWMIGDNPVADVKGVEDYGIPAMLIRSGDRNSAKRVASDMWETKRLLKQWIENR